MQVCMWWTPASRRASSTIRGLVLPLPRGEFLFQDLIREIHALVADLDLWTKNHACDFMLGLAAESAPRRSGGTGAVAVHRAIVPGDGTAEVRTRSPPVPLVHDPWAAILWMRHRLSAVPATARLHVLERLCLGVRRVSPLGGHGVGPDELIVSQA